MKTQTVLFQRGNAPPTGLEEPEVFHRRIRLAIGRMEDSGWAASQIVQIQDHHAFFVVFEKTDGET